MFFDGSYLSVVGDVVVVTTNYRLNVFGFLTSMSDKSPGNYGLWDQKMAIQWVHDNIESFGGNPNSVTIFGESAGGFSVGLHAINPSNKGLFQRVIAQSGVGTSLFATSVNALFASKSMAEALNCNKKFTLNTMNCLRNKSAELIFNTMLSLPKRAKVSIDIHGDYLNDFGPVVDGKIVPTDPQTRIKDPNSAVVQFFKSLDIIVGTCESEGSLLIYDFQELQKNLTFNINKGVTSEFFCMHIIKPFAVDFFNDTSIVPALCKQYMSNGSIADQGEKVDDWFGDAYFYSPSVQNLNRSTKSEHSRRE